MRNQANNIEEMHYGEKAILKKYTIVKLFSVKEHNYFLPPPRYWA